MTEPLVHHHYTITVDVPAKSGDGWSPYPDYSADNVGLIIRRALHQYMEFNTVVKHTETTVR